MRHENAGKTGEITGSTLCLPELREGKRTAVAHNATKCLERNTLLAESNQAASIEIHRLEKALAKAELERDVAREMLIERNTPDTRPGAMV